METVSPGRAVARGWLVIQGPCFALLLVPTLAYGLLVPAERLIAAAVA